MTKIEDADKFDICIVLDAYTKKAYEAYWEKGSLQKIADEFYTTGLPHAAIIPQTGNLVVSEAPGDGVPRFSMWGVGAQFYGKALVIPMRGRQAMPFHTVFDRIKAWAHDVLYLSSDHHGDQGVTAAA